MKLLAFSFAVATTELTAACACFCCAQKLKQLLLPGVTRYVVLQKRQLCNTTTKTELSFVINYHHQISQQKVL